MQKLLLIVLLLTMASKDGNCQINNSAYKAVDTLMLTGMIFIETSDIDMDLFYFFKTEDSLPKRINNSSDWNKIKRKCKKIIFPDFKNDSIGGNELKTGSFSCTNESYGK